MSALTAATAKITAEMDIQKNDTVELTIESLGYKGEGVARIDRVPVFIIGALPGETVRAIIILVKKDFLIGKLTEIVHPSPVRVKPKCPVFGKCGGCDLQHMDYDSQLIFKRDQVKNALKKIAGIGADVLPAVPSADTYGYRNKLSLPVRNVGGVTKIGFYAANSHRIIEIDGCPLQSQEAGGVLPVFKKWMQSVTAYDEEKGTGAVRHLSVRELGGYLSITVISAEKTDLSGLDQMLKQTIASYGLYLNINKQNNNVIFGDKTIFCGGSEAMSHLYGLCTYVHPAAFLQVNAYIAGKIYVSAAGHLRSAGAKRVLDAYSGGGLLTAILSKDAEEVTGIEIVPEAVASAKKLAGDNDIKNVTFILGDCAKEVPRLTQNAYYDTIVLDPPRQGCDEKVTAAVNASKADTVIYISCNPSTLARDIIRLDNYQIKEVTPFDMFPQTKHIETVICLQKK